jgi:hypothetical protein
MSQPDYSCHTALPASNVSVTFQGLFAGKTVTWEMQFATLAHWRKAYPDTAYRCPFIEIFPSKSDVFHVSVGLDLQVIDEPAIRKAIIMLRNYKRLALGKKEFCREAKMP